VNSFNRYANRSVCFMDVYSKGLSGVQAVWANQKDHGHRVLPNNILAEFDSSNQK
ncbi:hypothetical protein K439DRAFT_1361707, partial [Ramaria rubella]